MNPQERALKILQGEAWDEGYAAAMEDFKAPFDVDENGKFVRKPNTENPFVIWTDRD